jgi:general secretion pathway protein A
VAVLATLAGVVWQTQRGQAPSSSLAAASAASAAASPVAAASATEATGAMALRPAASAATPTPVSAAWPLFDPATDLARLPRDERTLWRELAPAWSVEPPPGDPCTPAPNQPLLCYRTGNGSLALVRLLDRPGLITLTDTHGGVVRARLVGLDANSVRLAYGPRQWTMPLEQLAGLWRGEFATYWYPPEGYTAPLADGAQGPAVQALATALARQRHENAPAPGAVFDATLRARLAAFQLAQGLKADGVAGPTTFMLLNRELGVAEPRLPSE